MNLNELSITEARIKLDQGEISSRDLTLACLKQIKKLDSKIKACLSIDEQGALLAAEQADQKINSSDYQSGRNNQNNSLLGIPYLVKDIIMTKGLKTTAASKILENYIAPYDASVIKKLKTAGAVLLGKTNLDEFAHGASTENSAYQTTHNPLDLSRVPGGSSGGSAAAVASNMCLFSIGSDTGGSIRQPASFCGIVGLKPSYGRVSRFGLLSMTSSTDVIGVLSKNIEDSALVLEVIAGNDSLDATSLPDKVDNYQQEMIKKKDLKGIKIGWPAEYFLDSLDPALLAKMKILADKLEKAGAKIKKISLPYTKYGIPVYYIITPSEISSNLARFDGIAWGTAHEEAISLKDFYKINRGVGFGPEVKRRIMLGTYVLSAGYYDAYYKKAQAVRTLIIKDFNKAFEKVDLLLTPTTPHPAFKIGQQIDDSLTMYMEDIFVTGASLAGLPAVSIPAGLVSTEDNKKMPIGAQLIAPRLQEALLFKVGKFLE